MQVRITETKSSGPSSLRRISSRISSSVAPRIEGSSLRSAWAAPRTAHRRLSPSLIGVDPSRAAVARRRAAAAPCPRPSSPRRSGPNAIRSRSTTSLPIASAIRRTWRLRPSLIVISTTRGETRRTFAAPGRAVLELDPVAQPPEVDVARRPAQSRAIGARYLEARVHQPVGELAVVGDQDQPGRVGVETADRIQPPLRVDQLGDRAPAPGLARGRGDPGRLVEDPHLARLGADRSPVDLHPALELDVARRVRDHLAAHPHPPGGDQRLGLAARGDSGVGEVLCEPHAAKLAPTRRAARRPSAIARAARSRPRGSGRSCAGSGSASRPLSPKRRSNSGVVRWMTAPKRDRPASSISPRSVSVCSADSEATPRIRAISGPRDRLQVGDDRQGLGLRLGERRRSRLRQQATRRLVGLGVRGEGVPAADLAQDQAAALERGAEQVERPVDLGLGRLARLRQLPGAHRLRRQEEQRFDHPLERAHEAISPSAARRWPLAATSIGPNTSPCSHVASPCLCSSSSANSVTAWVSLSSPPKLSSKSSEPS